MSRDSVDSLVREADAGRSEGVSSDVLIESEGCPKGYDLGCDPSVACDCEYSDRCNRYHCEY